MAASHLAEGKCPAQAAARQSNVAGEVETVRQDAVNVMLLNKFVKEHCKIEEQEKTIVELKSGMTALAAT